MGSGSSIWPFIIIILIIVLAYLFPMQFQSAIKWGGDEIKSIVGGVFDQKCPDTAQPVCGSNGLTYQNYCYAQKAKVNYTIGDCSSEIAIQ